MDSTRELVIRITIGPLNTGEWQWETVQVQGAPHQSVGKMPDPFPEPSVTSTVPHGFRYSSTGPLPRLRRGHRRLFRFGGHVYSDLLTAVLDFLCRSWL